MTATATRRSWVVSLSLSASASLLALLFSGSPLRPQAGRLHAQGPTGFVVLLHSRTFVPPPGMSPATRSAILQAGQAGRARAHVLIQFMRFPTTRDLSELRQFGLQLLVSIPDRAWYASLPTTSSALDAIAAHSAVRAIFLIESNDRVASSIRSDGVDPRLMFPDGTEALEIQTFDDVPIAAARQAIASFVAQILAESERAHTFLARASHTALTPLANVDEVQLIDEVPPPPEEDNDQVRINTNASNVQVVEDTVVGGAMTGTQPGLPYGLDADGVLIGQWEPRRPDSCHPDFQGTLNADGTITGTTFRVTFGADADGTSDSDCSSAGYQAAADTTIGDHATHVAGIVLGNGSQSAGAGGLALQWRGMAPNASIVAYLRPNLDTDGDNIAEAAPVATHATQYGAALGLGISLSVNSWGYTHCHQVGAATCYDRGAQLYDQLITDLTDVDRSAALSIVGSSGNQGGAFGTTRIPNSAKNTIVVGSITSDTNQLVTSSSRGPVDDGRLKPDVIAPGEQNGVPRVNSTVMTIFADDAPNGQGTLCNSNGAGGDGTDDCAFPYDQLGGTSMATPAVTGAAALLVEQFRTRGSEPWPSTVKALLVHTAVDQCCTDIAGNDADTPGPDYAYGYGKIDVQAAIDLLRDERNGRVVEAPGFGGAGACPTAPDQLCDMDLNGVSDDDTYLVTLPAGLASYRVTLVYDDPSTGGSVLARGAPTLRNDLDLFLIAPDGTVTRPWVLNPAIPAAAAARGRDALNPVEAVDVPNPASGTWTIVVRPTVLSPSSDLEPPQRYTLIYQSFKADVMIRDYDEDDGGVPSVRREGGAWVPARFWHSPEITIEGGESIEPGVERVLHVVVTNVGNTMVDDAVVQLYWMNSGIGLDYADFIANPMGLCLIPALNPGERSDPADCAIHYTWDAADLLIGADGSAHVCLLATVQATGDGITFPGYASILAMGDVNPSPDYVPWDNNLAQQNLTDEFTNAEDGTLDYEVHNPSERSTGRVEVVADTSELPAGWMVRDLPSQPLILPPGGRARARVTLVPPLDARQGTSGRIALYGRDLMTGNLLGGLTFLVGVGMPSPTPTRTGAATRPMATPTPTPARVEVRVGSATGAPGQQVTFAVTLRSMGPIAAGIQNDIRFAALASIARKANGRPDCMVNPAIDKSATSFAFQPPGCTGVDCNALRAFVFAADNSDPIPDGSMLYTCTVNIARSAAVRSYPLVTSEVRATDSASNPLGAVGTDGAIEVVQACTGDCNGDGQVTIDEVVRGVNIAVGSTSVNQCPSFDRNMDGTVTIDELVQAVNNALGGCP